jgi:hypothetical protein
MQLITFLSTASAMVATVSAAATAAELMEDFNTSKPYARVINRCNYDVHLWSILKGDGCPTEGMVTLKKGEIYNENYREADDGKTGVAIKISKTNQCKGSEIVQLEYFLERGQTGFNYNYLDVSYVDCESNCPTKQEGYYLQAGSQSGVAKASAENTWCPVMSCHDPVSCAKISYILPDDVQTKTCDHDQSMDFYMCGGEAPDEEPEAPESSAEPSSESSAKPTASSTEEAEYSEPTASSTEEADYSEPTPSEDSTTEAAAVTSAPENVNGGLTKTQVVYVTQYEYVNAKRHAHDHARRHQPFHA